MAPHSFTLLDTPLRRDTGRIRSTTLRTLHAEVTDWDVAMTALWLKVRFDWVSTNGIPTFVRHHEG